MREGKEEDGMADHICNHTFYRSIYIMPTETKKKKIEKNRKKILLVKKRVSFDLFLLIVNFKG